jgi:lysozyme
MITTAEFGGVASAQGLDVSNFQGRYDWAAAKKSTPALAFGIHRVTQGLGRGVNSPDPTASWNHGAIKAEGLHRGGYHFLDPVLDGGAQARYFADTWDRLGLNASDMLWLDNEDNKGGAISAARIAACAQAFMAELHHLLPHNPKGVYSNLNFGMIGADSGLGRWPWWAAHPGGAPASPPPWSTWTFWQWGTRNGVDADAFNGTAAHLDAWISSFRPAPPAPKQDGPVRRLTTGHLTLDQLAKERNTTPQHLFDMAVTNFTARDIGTIAALPLAQGTPYYTSN